MTLGEKINYYRKRSKLSQEELAERVGVSRQAVSKWELGDATPEVEKLLAGIALVLGGLALAHNLRKKGREDGTPSGMQKSLFPHSAGTGTFSTAPAMPPAHSPPPRRRCRQRGSSRPSLS